MKSINGNKNNKVNFMESISSRNSKNLNFMENTTTRNIKNVNLIVRLKYKREISGIIYDKEDDMILYQRETIEQAFNRYITKNGINIAKSKSNNFYVIRGEKYILLDKKMKIMDLDINFGDKIEVISSKDILETNSDFVYSIRKSGKKDKNKLLLKKILIPSIIILFLIILGILLYFFVFKKEKIIIEEENYEQEKLVTKINYTPDVLYRYESNKKTNMIVAGINETNNESRQSFEQYIDFIFTIRNKHFEVENNVTKKNWYTGYIGILNITINNGTDDMVIFYDKNLNKYINKVNNIRNLNSDNINLNQKYTDENDTACFIKIEFYENGEIKNIFIPKIFLMSNMLFIDNIIKLIIPKISPDLYTNNITDELIKLKIYSNESESSSNNEEEEEDEEIDEKEESKNNRILGENNGLQNNYDNDSFFDEYNMTEDYIENDNINSSINIELREINNKSQNVENDLIKNSVNITHMSYQSLENQEISLKGSELNTIIYSNINKNGILFMVKEIQTAVMNQPDNLDNDEEALKKEENLRKEIYNSDNQISMDDLDLDEKINSGLSFNLSQITMESINDISLIGTYDNEKLKRELYNYLDNFEYILYNKSNDTDNNLRILEDENDENENISEQKENIQLIKKYLKKRKLENNGEYYGMKKFTYEKEFFDYNLLGLVLRGTAVCELEPSTGVVNNYFTLKMSFLKKKFQLAVQQTNLHIIIENMNKMTYDFILLLYQSNENLKNNNIKYGQIIVDIEKNVSNLFEKYFDYSGIFTESLNNLYFQVNGFTGKFIEHLIELIDEVHTNFTLIYLKGMNNSYEFINDIREITKNAYTKYINNTLIILENFYNETLLFLDNIEAEVNKIDIFQIDLLYDIIDVINDAKIIFKEFNNNLYKAIEKGIIIFKYDIQDFIDNIIGELLYITDFLSININKNEILKKNIEEAQRNITTKKLKDFRNIIFVIMDLLVNQINDDYQNEMISDNCNGIRYYSENSSEKFINDIEISANKTTELIKTKINYIN